MIKKPRLLALFSMCIFFHLYSQDLKFLLTKAYQHSIKCEYDQALMLYEQALLQQPTNGHIFYNIGFILKKQQNMQAAIQIYEKARPHVSNKASIERALSSAYLAIGDFERGWPAYEYRWVQPPPYNQELKQYMEKGGNLHNKIVLIKTEYGLGDTLQFIRYAKILKEKGAYTIVESQKSLITLLSLCPYIDNIIAPGELAGSHFTVLLMSLPLVLGTRMENIPAQIPYLLADQNLVKHWKKYLDKDQNLKIGICWQADTHKNAQEDIVKLDSMAKSIPLHYLAQLSELPHVSLYSLQKINGVEQLENVAPEYSVHHFEHFDEAHGAFMDTAAIIMNLDLIITIDTSIAHLAGGLGKKVWLLLPYAADWRWLMHRDDSPWYPTMRLFRQSTQGDWNGVMQEIQKIIFSLIQSNEHQLMYQ